MSFLIFFYCTMRVASTPMCLIRHETRIMSKFTVFDPECAKLAFFFTFPVHYANINI
jgi:hypothetical protein